MFENILKICCDDIKGIVNSEALIFLHKLFQQTRGILLNELIDLNFAGTNKKLVELHKEINIKRKVVVDLSNASAKTGEIQQHCLIDKKEQIYQVKHRLEINYVNYEVNNMSNMIEIGDLTTKVRSIAMMEIGNFSVSYTRANKAFHKLQDFDKEEEATMRNQNLKLHNQIAEFINQYDTKCFAHQANLDKLTRMCIDNSATYHQLIFKLETQENIYRQCLYEKEVEETRLFQAKLYAFLSRRAATILQRAWRVHRAYLKRKKKKKSSKKQSKR